MTRVGNFGNRRSSIQSNSTLIRQLFEMTDRKGVYVKDVAVATGHSLHSATYWRRGKCCPSLLTLERIADKLGLEFVLTEKRP